VQIFLQVILGCLNSHFDIENRSFSEMKGAERKTCLFKKKIPLYVFEMINTLPLLLSNQIRRIIEAA